MAMKGNTRDRILYQAFCLYEKPRNKDISLSQVAAGVGISKAAIYKHFKSKDELTSAMEEKFLEDLCACYQDYGKGSADNKVFEIRKKEDMEIFIFRFIVFFLDNPYYTGYFLIRNLQNYELAFKLASLVIEKNLISRSGALNIQSSAEDCRKVMKIIFFLGTTFYFLSERLYCPNGYAAKLSRQEFIEVLRGILMNGLNRELNCIENNRIAELDGMCAVDEMSEQGSKMFAAFAKICEECGVTGVTVERLSEKMNLSKSSLYSYFDNIDDFVKGMLKEEFKVRQNFIGEKTRDAKNLDEVIYLLLRGQKNFQLARPYAASVYSWAVQRGISFRNPNHQDMKDEHKIKENPVLAFFNELGELDDVQKISLVHWIGMLTAFTAMFYSTNRFNKDYDYVPEMFALIECGMKKDFVIEK